MVKIGLINGANVMGLESRVSSLLRGSSSSNNKDFEFSTHTPEVVARYIAENDLKIQICDPGDDTYKGVVFMARLRVHVKKPRYGFGFSIDTQDIIDPNDLKKEGLDRKLIRKIKGAKKDQRSNRYSYFSPQNFVGENFPRVASVVYADKIGSSSRRLTVSINPYFNHEQRGIHELQLPHLWQGFDRFLVDLISETKQLEGVFDNIFKFIGYDASPDHSLFLKSSVLEDKVVNFNIVGDRPVFTVESNIGKGKVKNVPTRPIVTGPIAPKTKVPQPDIKTVPETPRAPEVIVKGDEPVEIDYQKPSTLVRAIQPYVIGQAEAVQIMAEGFCDHILHTRMPAEKQKKYKKNSILLVGPTGSGKTYIAQVASSIVGIPFVDFPLSGKTADGYVGTSATEAFNKLIEAAGDFNLAKTGVVFFDEFDKIAMAKENHGRDVRGADVQDELLPYIEGRPVASNYGEFDTSRLLYIFAGAFAGMDKIVQPRSADKPVVGFITTKDPTPTTGEVYYPSTEDFAEYGIKSELLGRMGQRAFLNELTEDELVSIMTQAKGSYVNDRIGFFGDAYEIQLVFDDSALHQIAAEAVRLKTGARAITPIINATLTGMRESELINDSRLVIDDQLVTSQVQRYMKNSGQAK